MICAGDCCSRYQDGECKAESLLKKATVNTAKCPFYDPLRFVLARGNSKPEVSRRNILSLICKQDIYETETKL